MTKLCRALFKCENKLKIGWENSCTVLKCTKMRARVKTLDVLVWTKSNTLTHCGGGGTQVQGLGWWGVVVNTVCGYIVTQDRGLGFIKWWKLWGLYSWYLEETSTWKAMTRPPLWKRKWIIKLWFYCVYGLVHASHQACSHSVEVLDNISQLKPISYNERLPQQRKFRK